MKIFNVHVEKARATSSSLGVVELSNVMDQMRWSTMFLDSVASAKARRIICDYVDFNVQVYCLECFQ